MAVRPATAGATADTATGATAQIFVAVCADGSEWVAVAAPLNAAMSLDVEGLDPLGAALSALPRDCDGVFAGTLPGDRVLRDPRDVRTYDAAVWSRGTQPVVRASELP